MYYLGIDCSSKNIHGVILDAEGKIQSFFACLSSEKKADDRLHDMINQFEQIVYNLSNGYSIAIEKAIYRQNPITTISIAQVVAGVKIVLNKHGLDYSVVDNKTWKRLTVGKGNVSKKDIKEYAMEKWGLPGNIAQDYYDASCLAEWCWKEGMK